MELDLTGRHALVCGASQGIGRATAHELALLGATVTALARSEAALADVVAALPRPAGQHHGHAVADMGDTEGLRAVVQAIVAAAPVHILINNSGGPPGGSGAGARQAEARPGSGAGRRRRPRLEHPRPRARGRQPS